MTLSQSVFKSRMPFTYFAGEVIPSEQAVVSPASHSLQYGTTVFSGMRGYFRDGKVRVFRLTDHFERLMQSAKILGMDFQMSLSEFLDIMAELIKKNNPQGDVYFRPFIFSPDEVLTPRFDRLNYQLCIYMISLDNYLLDPSVGLNLKISTWRKFPDSSIPNKAKAGGAYLHSSLAHTEATNEGYDEALVMDDNWNIVEGAGENLMMVTRGVIRTPAIGTAVLEGITMRSVVTLLEDAGKTIRHEPLDRSMIFACDELLLTGTAATVLYASSIDKRKIGVEGQEGPGEICQFLRKEFESLFDMSHPRSQEWMKEFSV